jgi:hypothetical protein
MPIPVSVLASHAGAVTSWGVQVEWVIDLARARLVFELATVGVKDKREACGTLA